VSTDWRNPGRTPVYESWEVTLELVDDTGAVRQSAVLPIALSAVGADNASLGTRTSIALNNQLPAGRYLARLVIRDPLQRSAPADARAPLRLAIAERQADGSITLGTLGQALIYASGLSVGPRVGPAQEFRQATHPPSGIRRGLKPESAPRRPATVRPITTSSLSPRSWCQAWARSTSIWAMSSHSS
jgi:hypothetical protein